MIAAIFTGAIATAFTTFVALVATPAAHAQTYTASTLYSFTGVGIDGQNPRAGLTLDSRGNLFGATNSGGSSSYGTVFKLTNTGTVTSPAYTAATTLYSFTRTGTDGAFPQAGLTIDSNGNLYGTTNSGGSSNYGTVFKLTNTGTVINPTYSAPTTLYSFTGAGTDGRNPQASLTIDSNGNLYGTTLSGGSSGFGSVFRLMNTGTVAGPTYSAATTLYSFTGAGTDGRNPQASLTFDSNGNLYGTTGDGGSSFNGTAFKLTNTGMVASPVYGAATTLYSFTGTGTDGAAPYANLTIDSRGNLYGTTYSGGSSSKGTVFKLTNTGTVTSPIYGAATTLYSFTRTGTDGAYPQAGLTLDSLGNLFGTTQQGGSSDGGTVFKLTNTGTVTSPTYSTATTLYSFTGTVNNSPRPVAGLTLDSDGNLFGTTVNGGSGYNGTVFELSVSGAASTPEPGSLALLTLGLLGGPPLAKFALWRRRSVV